MHQYAFQNNNNNQPQNNANNNGNASQIQQQMTHSQQIQQMHQGRMSQLSHMQQQFNQFSINQHNQNQTHTQTQNNPNAQSPPQNAIQNQQMQQMQQFQTQQNQPNNPNTNAQFAQNQIHAQQSQSPLQNHTQNNGNFNLQNNVNFHPQNNAHMQWNNPNQNAQIMLNGASMATQQPQMGTNTNQNNANVNDNVESSLNPEVAEFNPASFGQQAQSAQLTVQEQLFNQLQTINTQMQSIKFHTDNVLTPTLMSLNNQFAVYAQQPHLLQLPQNQMQYFGIQQQQALIGHQIQQNQVTYAQLEHNLKYTQDMYQKNKDEQYVVPIDETIQPMTDLNSNFTNPLQTQGMGMGMAQVPNTGNTITLTGTNNAVTLAGTVTDVGWQQSNIDSNGIQTGIQSNDNVNGSMDNNNEMNNDQNNGMNSDQNQEINTENELNNGMNTELNNGTNNYENEEINEVKPIEGEGMERTTFMNVKVNGSVNTNINEVTVNDRVDSRDSEEEQTQTQSRTPEPGHVEVEENITVFSRFRAKNNGGLSANSFGYNLNNKSKTDSPKSKSESPKSSSPNESPQNNTIAPPTAPMTGLIQSKSEIPVRKPKFRLMPVPLDNRARSLESQQSTDSNRFGMDEQSTDTAEKKEINLGQTRYPVMELIDLQKRFLYINWSKEQNREIPRRIRFISKGLNNEKFMEHVVAMFKRKSANAWQPPSHTGTGPKDRREKLMKKLTGVLNKMTPEKFDKIARSTMDIVNDFAETKDQMNIIIGLVLEFGIKQPVFGGQYAELCSHLHAHLPKLGMICEYSWVTDDKDVSGTFRKMVIQQTDELFRKYNDPLEKAKDEIEGKQLSTEEREQKIKKKKNQFFAVCTLVAELYNVELIKQNLVFKGVFKPLLKNPTAVNLEGLCRLFKRAGKKLDIEAKKNVDKIMQRLLVHARKFDFRTKVLVEDIKEMRENEWQFRLKQQVAKTKDEIKEEFDIEQEKQSSGKRGRNRDYDDGRGRGRGKGKGRRNRDYDDYEYDSYAVGYEDEDYHRGNHGYSTGNLRKLDRYSRRDRRTQSSMNLRADRGLKSRHSKYDDDHSWNDDSALDRGRGSGSGGGNGRYKLKQMSPSKSYGGGVYQKKERSFGALSRNKSEGQYSQDSSYGNAQAQSYGDAKMINSVKGYIDEYMASGVIDEILDLDCRDFKVWASVINDGLRDRKSAEIPDFIEFVLLLFENKVLDNKKAQFLNVVIKYLTIQMDESSTDCPNFGRYIAELFANLVHNEWVNPDPLYNFFIKKYKEYSEYSKQAQRKNINKIIKYSVNELHRLQSHKSLINNVQRKTI